MANISDTENRIKNWCWTELVDARAEQWTGGGMALAAMASDGSMEMAKRLELAQQAIQAWPQTAYAMAAISWIGDRKELRQALRTLGVDPAHGRSRHKEWSNDRGAIGPNGDPPLMLALRGANHEAIEEELMLRDPSQPIAAPLIGGRGHRQIGPGQPAGWLSWALFYGQWALADRLWQDPRVQRDAPGKDLALWHLMLGAQGWAHVGKPDIPFHDHDPLDLAGLLPWMERLLAAGADPQCAFTATCQEHAATVWFYGKTAGLDSNVLDGWHINNENTGSGVPNGARQSGRQVLSVSASELAWQGKLLVEPEPQGDIGYGSDEEAQARANLWTDARSRMGKLFGNTNSPDLALQAAVHSMAEQLWRDEGAEHHALWPSWINEMWSCVDARSTLDVTPDSLECLWLDLIGLWACATKQRKGLPSGSIETLMAQIQTGLDGIVSQATPNMEQWCAGVQRLLACAPNQQPLACRVLRETFNQMPAAFQGSFHTWERERLGMVEELDAWIKRWKQNGLRSEDAAPHEAAQTRLKLHLSILPSLSQDRSVVSVPRL